MQRTLSLVLDEEGFKSLTIIKDEADEIDKFTTSKFEDSEQIREYYKDKILPYLEENKNYINEIEKSSGKKYRGRIVLLEAHDYKGELHLLEKRVLYKKHVIAFKEIVKDQLTMKRFLELEKRGVNVFGFKKLISPFLYKEIVGHNYNKTRSELIRREIKKSDTFYDILRIVIKAYKLERKKRPHLKTIESIYKETVEKKQVPSNLKQDNFDKQDNFEENEEYFIVNGIRYKQDDMPFDLDDLKSMDADFKLDGLGGNDERIR